MNSIDELLLKKRILVVTGTGGVGKTTLSAALALRAALLGRKAVVVTVDPAKRLKNSLGNTDLSDKATDLTPLLNSILQKMGPNLKRDFENLEEKDFTLKEDAEFAAIVPNTLQTFERFIETISPSAGLTDKIKKNPIFQIFANEFSGANEYMALERLYFLSTTSHYDTIILDTPPSRNALALFEAPKLLSDILDEKWIKWIITPGNRLFSQGMSKVLDILKGLTGEGFLNNLIEFLAAVFEVRVKFLKNLTRITSLMRSEELGFLVVTQPGNYSSEDIQNFIQSIEKHEFYFDGVILNRTLGTMKNDSDTKPTGWEKAYQFLKSCSIKENAILKDLNHKSFHGKTIKTLKLPELARDVHGIEDLLYVAYSTHLARWL